MPIFEYRCVDCDHYFEELVRMSGNPRVNCPKCASKKVEKRHSVFAARADAAPSQAPTGGGCGRCGDPSGPCGM